LKIRDGSYKILSYKVKHNYNIDNFLLSYRSLLQKAVDIIWGNVTWVEKWEEKCYEVESGKKRNKKCYQIKRLVPLLPKTREFKNSLRKELLKGWSYASHYVDSAIKVAYSILKSWKKNYLKGERRRAKPTVKKLFARVKETLYTYKDGKIRVTVVPRKLYLEFDLAKAWFKNRVRGLDLGELILTKNELIITFRRPKEEKNHAEYIGWDSNLFSLDGFSPKYGWIKIDLSELYHIHRVHEIKRKRAQSIASKKNTVNDRVTKHGERERNRAKDFVHKLTTMLTRLFPNAVHGFEDLNKEGMFNESREHNRDIAKQNWRQIVSCMRYKSEVKLADPRYTSSTCPRCGGWMLKLQEGQVVRCLKCGLELDRQLCGAINIYLKMCGFPQSPSIFYRAVIKKMIPQWKVWMKALGGVTTKGGKGYDMPPMNSRWWLSLMSSKAFIGL